MKRFILSITNCLFLLFIPTFLTAQEVEIIDSRQKNENFHITYRLSSELEDVRHIVHLHYSLDGGKTFRQVTTSLKGDIGNVRPGKKDRQIKWEMDIVPQPEDELRMKVVVEIIDDPSPRELSKNSLSLGLLVTPGITYERQIRNTKAALRVGVDSYLDLVWGELYASVGVGLRKYLGEKSAQNRGLYLDLGLQGGDNGFGVAGGVGYKIPLGKKIFLNPSARFLASYDFVWKYDFWTYIHLTPLSIGISF